MSEWTGVSKAEIVATLRDSVDRELADEIERRLEFYDRWTKLPHHMTQRIIEGME